MKKTMIIGLLLFAGWMLTAPVSAQEAQPAEAQPTTTEQSTSESAEATDAQTNLAEEAPDRLWDAASTAYINGDYAKAVKAYEQLVARELSSAKLYYNLANAYFKEEQLSRSILFYRRALRLDPGNADARYNLIVAEARTKDNIERIPEFFLTEWFRSIRRTMGCTGWSILSLIALACGLGLGLLYLLSQRLTLRKTGFYGSLAAAVVFVLTTGFAMGERHTMLDRSEAVVMSSSAAIKSAPDRSATDLFILHEGTTVRITDELDRWCEVTIADGKKGWVERSKIETI